MLFRLSLLQEEEAKKQDQEISIMVLKEPVDAPPASQTPSPPKEDAAVPQAGKAIAGKKKKK